MSGIDEAQKERGSKINDLVFKISRSDDEYGSYSIAVVPSSKYPMTTEPEVEVDTDTSYRYGLFRTSDEMREYLRTGVMPKHQKTSNGTVGENIYFTPKTDNTTTVAPNTPTTIPNTTTVAPNTPTSTIQVVDTLTGATINVVNNDKYVEHITTSQDFVLPF